MAIFSINKSRLGYNYQDKYSLYEILNGIISKKLTKAYTDFGFKSGKGYCYTLDLRLIPKDSPHEIFEIKSGDDFKSDPNIKAQLRPFWEYEKIHGSSVKNIVIHPEYTGELLRIKSYIEDLKNNRRPRQEGLNREEIKQRIISKTQLDDQSEDECLDFLLSLNFPDAQSYRLRDSIGSCNLESLIEDKIDRLSKELGINRFISLYPASVIVSELLEVIRFMAEKNEDNLQPIYEQLFECLVRRKCIQSGRFEKDENSVESIFKTMREDFQNDFSNKLDFSLVRNVRYKN